MNAFFSVLSRVDFGPQGPSVCYITWSYLLEFLLCILHEDASLQQWSAKAWRYACFHLQPVSSPYRTCHLSVSDGEGRKGPRDSNANRMLLGERLWLWCIQEHVTRCISAWGNEGDDTGWQESDLWELDMWFWLHVPSLPTSTSATSALAITILTWRIVFPTCSVLRQPGLATSKV